MTSRPLLDYLAYPDHAADAVATDRASADRHPDVDPASVDALEARLRDLATRLRANMPSAPAPTQDLTLSAQIEAILKRKMPQAAEPHPALSPVEPAARRARLALDPPPSVPAIGASASIDPEFAKFSEAVYLIGQAARRFVDDPHAPAAPARQVAPTAPSTAEIDALSAVLRETVSAFRSVADDLAVSAGEIRSIATRGERTPYATRSAAREDRDGLPELQETISAFRSVARELAVSVGEIKAAARHDDRQPPARPDHRGRYPGDEDEILELRESVVELQDRLDLLLHARRRARY